MTPSHDSPAIINKAKSKKVKLTVLSFIIATILIFLSYAVIVARSNAKIVLCRAYFYQLCYAINDYQDLHGHYPKYVSPDGVPLWSWRLVMQEPQFTSKNYHRDEFWNSKHNLQIISQSDINEWFVCPLNDSKDSRASYVAVTGKGTAWTEGTSFAA